MANIEEKGVGKDEALGFPPGFKCRGSVLIRFIGGLDVGLHMAHKHCR